jgi:hypothetical protein
MSDKKSKTESTSAASMGPQALSPEQERMVREYVRARIKEVVRKKPGGGGYVLYSPNKGKKNPPKPVGEFPTKLGAKRAELTRYPPKDAAKLKALRKQIDRIQKDPKKRAEKEREWAQGDKVKNHGKPRGETPKKSAKESVDALAAGVASLVREALFREEEAPVSGWDERVARLSKAAVEADSKLQKLQKDIEKKTVSALQAAAGEVEKVLKKQKIKATCGDVRRDPQRMKSYVEITLDVDGVQVGPLYIFVEGSRLKFEVSGTAKASLGRLKPDRAKTLRSELATMQEDLLDKRGEIVAAVKNRDKYLDGLQNKADGYVSDLSALEISVLKSVLVDKFRGK